MNNKKTKMCNKNIINKGLLHERSKGICAISLKDFLQC